ncbi:putative NBD/HSP70 family sugar kinase [Stackebrandtia endophytica]|uniref:Putative NBD/HSP70 family sugar kinase n=1 Tax=Stackebrandtia endophytica TaxID=1496996 RepID=A0A543B1A0_9ACTN|nr:ROK family transcriptional regulator [Stackebrandtia endophytica]TQL78608.1 putative NBD/HSP70 family sugar kinase [Stackebrandtia endophytica]
MTALTPDVANPSGSSRLLRQINDRAALGCLFLRGRLTRPELVELTGLSKPTASEVIRRLREANLVTVAGRTSGGPGPRADVYSLNPDALYGVAVSIREPDRLALAIVDLTGQTRHEHELTVTYRDSGVAEVIAPSVRDLFALADLPIERLGHAQVAVPGSYDARGDVVRNIDVPGCDRAGLRDSLHRALDAAVDIDNDVNLATLAERHHGGGGSNGFALLWLGERGMGLGIDLGGGLLHGFGGGAGEIGYLPTGEGSTLQDVAGGPAIRRLAADAGYPAESAGEAMRLAVHDERFRTRLAARLVPGLTAIVAVTDPAVIVLSGEVGAAGGQPLARALADQLRRTAYRCEVVESSVTGDAVLRGAKDAVTAALREAVLTGTT